MLAGPKDSEYASEAKSDVSLRNATVFENESETYASQEEELADDIKVEAHPPSGRPERELSPCVLVHQAFKGSLEKLRLAIGSDGEDALKRGGEEGVDGRSSDTIQTKRVELADDGNPSDEEQSCDCEKSGNCNVGENEDAETEEHKAAIEELSERLLHPRRE